MNPLFLMSLGITIRKFLSLESQDSTALAGLSSAFAGERDYTKQPKGKLMSWAFKIAGDPADVARDLRALKQNQYQDPQRDAVIDLTAAQVDAFVSPAIGYGVLVEGNGHQGSNFKVSVELCQISAPQAEAESPAPTEAAPVEGNVTQAPTNGDDPAAVTTT